MQIGAKRQKETGGSKSAPSKRRKHTLLGENWGELPNATREPATLKGSPDVHVKPGSSSVEQTGREPPPVTTTVEEGG